MTKMAEHLFRVGFNSSAIPSLMLCGKMNSIWQLLILFIDVWPHNDQKSVLITIKDSDVFQPSRGWFSCNQPWSSRIKWRKTPTRTLLHPKKHFKTIYYNNVLPFWHHWCREISQDLPETYLGQGALECYVVATWPVGNSWREGCWMDVPLSHTPIREVLCLVRLMFF